MKGSYTLKKPDNSKHLVVVDVNVGRPSFTSTWGWRLSVDDEGYSVLMKEHITREEFDAFAKEADEALTASILQSGGLLGNILLVLTCCICMACIKFKVDAALDRAVDRLQGVTKKWNDKFAANDRPLSIKVKHIKRAMNRHEIRADGRLDTHMDNVDRYSELDDEIWLEFEMA